MDGIIVNDCCCPNLVMGVGNWGNKLPCHPLKTSHWWYFDETLMSWFGNFVVLFCAPLYVSSPLVLFDTIEMAMMFCYLPVCFIVLLLLHVWIACSGQHDSNHPYINPSTMLIPPPLTSKLEAWILRGFENEGRINLSEAYKTETDSLAYQMRSLMLVWCAKK